MGKQRRKRKNATVAKLMSANDARIETPASKVLKAPEAKKKDKELIQAAPVSSDMFLNYNARLGPPYHILIDTNFINFSIQNKLEMIDSMMNCLYAKCTAYITDCVMGELEKLGPKFRVALRIAKDPRIERLPCTHRGTYADDCLVRRVMMHKCWIVATCDRDLRRRIRRIPGVPIMYIKQRKYTIERMPDAYGAPE